MYSNNYRYPITEFSSQQRDEVSPKKKKKHRRQRMPCGKRKYFFSLLFRQSMEKQMKLFPLPFGFRRPFAVLLIISGVFIFTFSGTIKKKYFPETSTETYQAIIQLTDNGGFVLDTPGCKVPLLDPFDKSVKHLLKIPPPWICPGKPSPLVVMPNGVLTLNESVLETHYNISQEMVECSFQPVIRLPEPKGKAREEYFSIEKSHKLPFGVPLIHDLLVVKCTLGNENLTQYIAGAPLKPQVEVKKTLLTKKPAELSVILVGVDSVSKLNFLRYFKKTYQFLKENLSPFEFEGHVKVGDNTFPNLVPMLTGHFVEHYWNESVRNTMFFDDVDIIWKKYSEIGHRTFFAEDNPYFGTFHYGKRGFKNKPTDYYYRALALAIDNSKVKKNSATYCMNSQLETDIIYTYLKNFISTMNRRPFFAFAMVSILTHGILYHSAFADEPTYRVLKYIWESGALDNSVLIFFSDHGIRFGAIRETYSGKFEERMPFMFLNFPKWFLKKYPEYAKNLRINQRRLTTHFDIHATLVHLLNTTGNVKGEPIATPHGMSLMGEISGHRTCEQASILPHWCPCQVYQSVPVNESTVVSAATAIIDSMNEQLKPFRKHCALLQLDKILNARSGELNEKVLRFLNSRNDVINRHVEYGDRVEDQVDYLITVKAKPSGGVFEGTVRREISTNNFTVQDISRLNEYGKQSTCIESQLLRKFCYCVS